MRRFLARFLLPGIPLAAASLTLHAQQSCFSSTGGPGGDFDWVVHDGEIFFFDTSMTVVVGGPNGVPTSSETVIGGEVEVRNLVVEAGGEIRVIGPNTMRVQASGDVIVRGRIDLSGFSGRDVATLNTGNQVELGGAGGPSGGGGGNANVQTTQPSPRGGAGRGPSGQLGAGGQGGESRFAPGNLGKDARRPGGGGGARFSADQPLASVPAGLSLVASDGNDGHPLSTGAESGMMPAQGGTAGGGAFVDGKPENDFYGMRPVRGRNGLIRLIRGELAGLWGGYGGGGGGNAMQVFPNPNWNFASDEKGGGGGGGGGTLHIQALGRIVFGAEGEILSNGANGGTGENTNFLDHVGGTGGAGSGGHVVLESAQVIDFTDGGANAGAQPRDWVAAYGRPLRTGPVRDVSPCCRTYSNGGASGGGVLQLHVPNPLSGGIVLPTAVMNQRNPLDAVSSPQAYALLLTCDPTSPAPFRWLEVGSGAGRSFLRSVGELPEELDLASELVALELPRRF
jgi:hypothetical protein